MTKKEVTVFRVFLRSQQIPVERESARAEQKAEIQVANRRVRRALKTPFKVSLPLPSDIFCQSGHSLCRICQRTRTCPAGQKIRVIVRFPSSTCYVLSTGTRRFLHGKPRRPRTHSSRTTFENFFHFLFFLVQDLRFSFVASLHKSRG